MFSDCRFRMGVKFRNPILKLENSKINFSEVGIHITSEFK
jgi:hypothetical protein